MMRSDDLEARASRAPRRGPPPAWRAQILNAAAEAAAVPARRDAAGPGWAWGRRWTWAWSTLAAAWAAILALHVLTPRPVSGVAGRAMVHAPRGPGRLPEAVAGPSQRRLLVQLLGEEGAVPVAPGPRRERPMTSPPRGDRRDDGYGLGRPSTDSLPSFLA
jgi:hypothetical protein